MSTTVTCPDGEVRHEPFASHFDAEKWAEWGHCCTGGHVFAELVECGEYADGLVCPCGNATHLSGFTPCDETGRDVVPTPADWPRPLYRCVDCDRIYDFATHHGTTVAVIRGPQTPEGIPA